MESLILMLPRELKIELLKYVMETIRIYQLQRTIGIIANDIVNHHPNRDIERKIAIAVVAMIIGSQREQYKQFNFFATIWTKEWCQENIDYYGELNDNDRFNKEWFEGFIKKQLEYCEAYKNYDWTKHIV